MRLKISVRRFLEPIQLILRNESFMAVEKILTKGNLPDWIDHLSNNFRLIAPVAVNGGYVFTQTNGDSKIELRYPTTYLPPKKVLLPQQEDLFQFDGSGRVRSVFDDRPTVLLGVHTCDLAAIGLLDNVFLHGFTDHHYGVRRENTILVSIECLTVCSEYAFCKDMNTLSLPGNFDLHLTDIGDAYMLYVGSDKAYQLLQGSDQVRNCRDEDYRKYQQVMSKKWANFAFRLKLDISAIPSLMKLSTHSTLWDEIDERCLGCGTCTIVCPTCYCFDIVDEVDFSLESGRRFRVWDSCQLNQFASVAGGHDFRPSRAKRQRHRFNRKYNYQSIAPGQLGCVGCGRCAMNCLAKIDPVDVISKLNQQQVVSKPRQVKVMK